MDNRQPITLRTLSAHNVKIGAGCFCCSTFRAVYGFDERKLDDDLVEAWNAGKLVCRKTRKPLSLMTFDWDNPMGSRDYEVARWDTAGPAVAFELPDPQRGPLRKKAPDRKPRALPDES